MQTAHDRRYRKRLPCRLEVPNGAYTGMVLNLSRGGLFVQTSAAASPGEAVHLDLSLGEADAIGLDTRVVWRRVVAPHLRSVSTGGMGVHIQYANDAYFGFVARLAEAVPEEPAPAPPQSAAGPSFRVRLRLAGGSRTRILTISGADEGDARVRARKQAGPQWAVLDLERIEREA